MQFSVEITQGLWRRLSITVPTESIQRAMKKELLNVSKSVQINGFRKLKAPCNILKKRYGDSIRQKVFSEVMHRSFINVIVKEKINLAGKPYYTPSEYKEYKDFNFVVDFEVYPNFELTGLDSIRVEKPVVEVTDADVASMLETLRKQQVNWKESDHPVKPKDRVTLDFIGFIDGKAFKGGKESDFILPLGQSRMLPGFEENLLGHKAGESFTINVNFPEDYHIDNLSGKLAKFAIILKKVEEPELPELTKKFIQRFGVANGSINDLRAQVRQNMEREMKIIVRNCIKTQVISGLINANNIELPSALIESEANSLRLQALKRFRGDKKQTLELPRSIFEEKAKKYVAVSLLLGKVIHTNNLKADEGRMKTLIEEIAPAYEDPKAVVNCYKKNKELLDNIRAIALEDQAIEVLLKKAKVTHAAITFSELINQPKYF